MDSILARIKEKRRQSVSREASVASERPVTRGTSADSLLE
jgi:hypothetical protein